MNFLCITLFFNIFAGIAQNLLSLGTRFGTPSHRSLPPALWTTSTSSCTSSSSLKIFPSDMFLLVKKHVQIAGREIRTVRRMVQYIPLEFFQKCSGDVRGIGSRVVVEHAHAAWQNSFPFVLNGSKPCQGVTIWRGINCWARRHEVDQENAFSVPENGSHNVNSVCYINNYLLFCFILLLFLYFILLFLFFILFLYFLEYITLGT